MSDGEPASYPPWRTNFAKASGIAAIMAVALYASGSANLPGFIVGIPPFVFMVYSLLSSRNARRAQKAEEEADLDVVEGLMEQCEALISQIGSLAADGRGGQRASLALAQLFATARLISSRYGRYLGKEGVWALLEVERMIIDAGLPGRDGLGYLVEPLADQMGIVGGSVLDIDDPRLRAAREAL